jgi:hypothetical protein
MTVRLLIYIRNDLRRMKVVMDDETEAEGMFLSVILQSQILIS